MLLKKTIVCLSLFTISALLVETACTTETDRLTYRNPFFFFKQDVEADTHDTSTSHKTLIDVNQNIISNQVASTVKPTKVYESLWDSDLFAEDRFLLNIKLTDKEKVLAKELARSFEKHMKDSTLIMHYILTELKERNLPIELAALPLVESGFNPRARSNVGAKGPWQFMKGTGKYLGLETSSNYDEFYDFVESTKASLTFLEHLYNELDHNWDLAIAAYNQGEFAVKKAIRKAKKDGIKEVSLKNVKLSSYAYVYVSKFRAYADILKNTSKYNVKRPTIQNRPAFKSVVVAGRINSMKQAAELSGVNIELLKHLNAGFLTDSLTTVSKKELLVPIDYADKFEKALEHRKI